MHFVGNLNVVAKCWGNFTALESGQSVLCVKNTVVYGEWARLVNGTQLDSVYSRAVKQLIFISAK